MDTVKLAKLVQELCGYGETGAEIGGTKVMGIPSKFLKQQGVTVPKGHSYKILDRIKAVGLELPVPEYKFCPDRRWRFDFAYPHYKIALEYEGGTWAAGRHTRGSGFAKDCEKYNRAAVMGWTVLRYTSNMIDDVPTDLYLLNLVKQTTK